MIYRFATYQESGRIGCFFTGTLSVPADMPPDRVTIKVGQLCARRACKDGLTWDPFNLSIAIMPQTPKEQPKCIQ
jgi:hypothetical protein